METRLVNLQLVLEELGIDPSIHTLDERVTFQKAIYLAQAMRVPLRYRYSWYIRGPYSRDLTRDYYALHEYPNHMAGAASQKSIREPFLTALRKLKAIMSTPEGVDLVQKDWLELLSSVHFLRTSSRLDAARTRERIDAEKPSLSPYTDRATRSLTELELIQE